MELFFDRISYQKLSIEEAIKRPVLKQNKKSFYEGLSGEKYKTKEELCKNYHICTTLYYQSEENLSKALKKKQERYLHPICIHGYFYKNLQEYIDIHNLNINKVYYYRKKHPSATLEEAITKIEKFKEAFSLIEVLGKDPKIILKRIKKGGSFERALYYEETSSHGEELLKFFLEKNKIKYLHNLSIGNIYKNSNQLSKLNKRIQILQKKYESRKTEFSPKLIYSLRPDFIILKDNKTYCSIEFDGEQHFKFVNIFHKSNEDFYKKHFYDIVKNDFLENENIPLLRIRYDQIENVDVMINDLLENPNKYLTQHNTFLTEEEYWEPFKKNKDSLALSF